MTDDGHQGHGSRPKKHHYVPAGYLAQFTQRGSGRDSELFAFDLKTGEQRQSTPGNEGYKKYLYKINGDDPLAIEHALATLDEDFANELLPSIVSSQELPSSQERMGSLLTFVGLQAVRTARFIGAMRDHDDELMRGLVDMIAHEEGRFRTILHRFEQATGQRTPPITPDEFKASFDNLTLPPSLNQTK